MITDECCGSCKFRSVDIKGRLFCACANAEEWYDDVAWNHRCMCYETGEGEKWQITPQSTTKENLT